MPDKVESGKRSEFVGDIGLRDILVRYGKFPGPTEMEMARALYQAGEQTERDKCAQQLEEMAMKYTELVRWALNKGAEIIRARNL